MILLLDAVIRLVGLVWLAVVLLNGAGVAAATPKTAFVYDAASRVVVITRQPCGVEVGACLGCADRSFGSLITSRQP